MTVDLEDYYCDLDFKEWPKYENRIIETTNILLELFEKHKTTATFFTVGYIAEKFPELIEKILREGHEIGSHGYSHLDIRKISKEKFEEDLLRSIQVLEKISGQRVHGFRAPYFSIDSKTFWALEIIRKHLKYDSSIFPVRTPLYGIPNAPRNIYRPSKKNPLHNDEKGDFVELPLATISIPIIGNIPIAGGVYLRFLPNWFIKLGIRKINRQGNPAMCYIHPKDLDEKMPSIPEYGWYYYYGLKRSLKKFESLLHDFKFNSVCEVIEV